MRTTILIPGVAELARLLRLALAAMAFAGLSACSLLNSFQPMVGIEPMSPGEYIAFQRGDILTTGRLSAATEQTIRVTGLDTGACAGAMPDCLAALAEAKGVSMEQRLSAAAELWLRQALSAFKVRAGEFGERQAFKAAMEAARYAYAYLFLIPRDPVARAFEDRQTQVRDWYNTAVQLASTQLFDARSRADDSLGGNDLGVLDYGGWTMRVQMASVRSVSADNVPQELLPASSLAFHGLRSIYRRDGIGAELVAVLEDAPVAVVSDWQAGRNPDKPRSRVRRPAEWSEMPSPNLTVLFLFDGDSLKDALRTREARVVIHDPYEDSDVMLHGQRVPLAANFTAGYGLWLARSDFSRQSLRTLFGSEQGIDKPHLYMMQPFDPDRRIILMLHGLASSPEAWVNVANEILGDAELREAFQVWQVYYPTSVPVAINHAQIRQLVTQALHHFDPEGAAPASSDMVLIGHSMGGMIARLMVSSADQQLWRWVLEGRDISADRLERLHARLDPMLRFSPMPNAARAIFIAAPHRGTAVAGERLVRWISQLIRLPLRLLESFDDVVETLSGGDAGRRDEQPRRTLALPNSIDNLSADDAFVKVAADLPISPEVRYHSIIARENARGSLEDSGDGLVPYRSAHLPGAVSEKVIVSGHSVQETATAILEIRRILHEDLKERAVKKDM